MYVYIHICIGLTRNTRVAPGEGSAIGGSRPQSKVQKDRDRWIEIDIDR